MKLLNPSPPFLWKNDWDRFAVDLTIGLSYYYISLRKCLIRSKTYKDKAASATNSIDKGIVNRIQIGGTLHTFVKDLRRITKYHEMQTSHISSLLYSSFDLRLWNVNYDEEGKRRIQAMEMWLKNYNGKDETR